MGLDITTYFGIEPCSVEEAELLAADDDEGYWNKKLAKPWANPAFPGRDAGLNCERGYRYQDSFHFRAGSYSGYNHWRRGLAYLVGITDIHQLWDDHPAGESPDVPFGALLHFSDCEGVIGPEVSKSLADDFQAWEAAAVVHADEHWRRKYQEWKKAFCLVAENGGWVDFH